MPNENASLEPKTAALAHEPGPHVVNRMIGLLSKPSGQLKGLTAASLALLGAAAALGLGTGAKLRGQERSAVATELAAALARAGAAERVPVLIQLRPAGPPRPLALDPDRRAAEHASNLAGAYESERAALLTALPTDVAFDLSDGEAVWISGATAARLTPGQVRALEVQAAVQRVYYDGLVPVDLAAGAGVRAPLHWAPGLGAAQDPAGGLPWGLEAIGAPRLWEAGATGAGAVVAIIDSGVNGEHPLLRRKWRGRSTSGPQAWFDPWGISPVPVDDSGTGGVGHGTIVTSVAVGALEPGDTLLELGGPRLVQDELEVVTGVAPGAEWVAANAFETFGGIWYTRRSVLLQSMQWVLDPDGDPATVSDVPDVVNNSWGFRPGGCEGVFDRAIDALEAAGIPVVFAAGNRQAGFDTVAAPADRADLLLNAFAVGAAEQRGAEVAVADNSLGGPSPCMPGAVKPEVVAPGDVPLVRAQSPGTAEVGGRSGAFTSWAAPHVTGALALLSALDPGAGANDLKDALFSTAMDLPPAGLDNRSGAGLIDLEAAAGAVGGLGGVQLALAGWSWDRAASRFTVVLRNAGDLIFPGGEAELWQRAPSRRLAWSVAPAIAPGARGEIVFTELVGEEMTDGRLSLRLESLGASLDIALALEGAVASSLTLSDGEIQLSLDGQGRLGRVAGSPGFSFLGEDWLTGGAFLLALGDAVSDAAYTDVLQQPALKSNPIGSDTDWRAVSSEAPGTGSAELAFDDDRALRSLGSTVRQEVELSALDDSAAFALLRATVEFNDGPGLPLAGLFLDWDFDAGDAVGWDMELRASVMFPADSSGPWMALATGTGSPTTHAAVPLGVPEAGFYVVGEGRGVLAGLEGFTDAEKARLMRLGGRQAADRSASDWAQLVTVGPLRSGATRTFVIAAASSRSALGFALEQGRAAAAQGRASQASASPGRLELLPAYPNPFDPSDGQAVNLPFLIDRGGDGLSARLEIFTIAGRLVYSERREFAADEPLQPFRWSGVLEGGAAAATGVYGYVLQVAGQKRSGKFVLLK